MSKPYYRKTIKEDIGYLADNLRVEDQAELALSSGSSPLEVLEYAFRFADECYTVVKGDRPVAMFGVQGDDAGAGIVWMLATNELKSIRKSFLKECRSVVAKWEQEYLFLYNHAWDRNIVHLKWLEWLGFTLEEPKLHGPYGALFRFFHKGRTSV